MLTIIDSAGRLVVPKAMREQAGIAPGPVEVTVDRAASGSNANGAAPPWMSWPDSPSNSTSTTPTSSFGLADANAIRELRHADQR
ncbi:MAG: AbrB/MazE/SpoVT family DNA-binding domain-containing protein [Propionibacteriaceae bacterium]|jgi:hypothetical protein|nr:AbrB/MazE/SpoVT family DNA-binding domain-containing protein [Propionibacteriaceae bacterium]